MGGANILGTSDKLVSLEGGKEAKGDVAGRFTCFVLATKVESGHTTRLVQDIAQHKVRLVFLYQCVSFLHIRIGQYLYAFLFQCDFHIECVYQYAILTEDFEVSFFNQVFSLFILLVLGDVGRFAHGIHLFFIGNC